MAEITIFKRKYNMVIKKLNTYNLDSLDTGVIEKEFLSAGFHLNENRKNWSITIGNLQLSINPIIAILVCEKVVFDNNLKRVYTIKNISIAEKLPSLFSNRPIQQELVQVSKQVDIVQRIANKTGLFRKLTHTSHITFIN